VPVRRSSSATASRARRIAQQRQSMQAAASGAPIQLRDAFLGGLIPGGPAYGAERDGRQVLVQRGAAGTGANIAGSINFAGQTLDPLTVGKDVMWVPRGSQPTEIERLYGIGAGKVEPDRKPEPPAPGLAPPDAYGDPAERARESEMRRMMQQYASKEYWATEEGKAKRDLALQDRYEGKDLAGYYGAQKAVGIGGFDEVISGLEQRDARYAKGGDLRAWAEANKDLALREYLKQFPAMEERGGPDRIAVEQAMKDGTFYPADGSPNPLGEKSELITGIDPGITMGPPAGVIAGVNHRQTAASQPTTAQAAATGTGITNGMQPLSAAAQGSRQPAEPLAPGNIPDRTLNPAAVDLRDQYKRMIQDGVNGSSLYGGGR
jgi:hypothetical protein